MGELVSSSRPEALGAVLEKAVRNEHVGRLAWAALYGWAERRSYAPAVIALCRRILEDSSAATSLTKRATVRLRRVAHKNADAAGQVLAAYDDLVQHPTVAKRLVAEVQGWQNRIYICPCPLQPASGRVQYRLVRVPSSCWIRRSNAVQYARSRTTGWGHYTGDCYVASQRPASRTRAALVILPGIRCR